MTQLARILIVTSGNLCRNPRPAKEAAALARAGYHVTVLRPSEGPAFDRMDADLAQGAGYTNEFIRPPAGDAARWLLRLQRWAALRLVPWGIEPVLTLGPARALWRRARAHAADLTLVHNEAALWVGQQLLHAGLKVSADIEDWYSEDLPVNERSHRPLKRLRQLEAALLHQACHVTTTSTALSKALQARYGGRSPTVVTNSFPLQPDPRATRPLADTPSFFWFSQTIGPNRGLEAFVRPWSQLTRPSRLVLLGQPRPGFADHLLSTIPASRRPYVEFRDLVPPQYLPGVIAQHDIGLALEQGDIASRDATITNKILQYLNAGLAVVATPTAGQREVHAYAPDAVRLFDPAASPAAAQAVLQALLDDPAGLRAGQEAARRAAETRYCWEQEEPGFLAHVRQALIPIGDTP